MIERGLYYAPSAPRSEEVRAGTDLWCVDEEQASCLAR